MIWLTWETNKAGASAALLRTSLRTYSQAGPLLHIPRSSVNTVTWMFVCPEYHTPCPIQSYRRLCLFHFRK